MVLQRCPPPAEVTVTSRIFDETPTRIVDLVRVPGSLVERFLGVFWGRHSLAG